jgi:hypothetical protein
VHAKQIIPRAAISLAGMLLALWSPGVLATADGPDFFAVRGIAANDVLNIRAEPRASARRLGAIPPEGQCIRNLGCQGGLSLAEFTGLTPEQQQQRLRAKPRWCKVQYQGVTGWVAGRYLGEGADGGGSPCPR